MLISSKCIRAPRILPGLTYAIRNARINQDRHLTANAQTSRPHEQLLATWRNSGLDSRTWWGEKGAEEKRMEPVPQQAEQSLAAWAVRVLGLAEPEGKIRLCHAAWMSMQSAAVPVGEAVLPAAPARPALPKLVPAKQIPAAKHSGLPLNVYMLHSLAHVELNAVDLACDTVARFSGVGLPQAFYTDFLHVADDESRHLGWCLQRLRELDHEYGDMDAHTQLWDGAQASAGDLLGRLVIVPCSQEARGLDAGDRLVQRLRSSGDARSAAIVQQIALEERAHVAVGAFWFTRLCAALDADAGDTFRGWLADLCPELLQGNFNHTSRQAAGLQRSWYDGREWSEEALQRAQPETDRQQSQMPSLTGLANADKRRVLERLYGMLEVETLAAT